MSDKYQALRDALKACPTSMDFDNAAMTQGVIDYEVSKWPLANFYSEANPATITALLADLDAAVSMLEKVAEWGPFPRVPDVYSDEPGATISYGLAYGSNGERDYIRGEVRATLSQIKAAGREQA